MFNFNKVAKEKYVEPTLSEMGVDLEHSNGSRKQEKIDNMYIYLLDGGEMGVVRSGEYESAKNTFASILDKFPEEIDKLCNEKPENIKAGLDQLLSKMN